MTRKRLLLHLILFIITFLTTVLAGALQSGVNVFEEPEKFHKGLPFAFTLMSILLAHELSHYIASKKHNIEATLPYFIPAPTLIGTFGAFIKMKSPVTTRKALLDIGISGPLAGFIVSVIVSVIGLYLSRVVPVQETKDALSLGDSLLFATLSQLILDYQPGSEDVLLHPVAFAGWIGFFVTSLTLLPIGQLDGGHIAYGLFGRRSRVIFLIAIVVMAFITVFYNPGWFLLLILIILFGFRHPPPIDDTTPLDWRRKIMGGVVFLVFL